ncbi:hypothetical protein [Mesorhizobium sp. ES1-1]|uniref:hypothetical protein n=1 Tax=Mesorhizobium sp. ES1-1 TaxID=2876629 RepID=UPI001CCEBD64|nr:hypothetical protein [Mesorhizobium sp. ES1-1]MBZ9677614.1 hypothetical protein [Mesorhizobium sp. ES1-1]
MPLESLIDQYVRSRKRSGLLSTQLALKALKEVVPSPAVADGHLVNMIADRAVACGLVIHFDHVGDTCD